MSAQIGRDHNFPSACKRCGGLLYENFEFCPYCGTEFPLDKVVPGTPPKATLTPLGATAATPPAPAAAKMAPAGAPATEGPSLNPDYPPAAQSTTQNAAQNGTRHFMEFARNLRSSQPGQWIFPRGLFVIAFVLAFAYGTYLLLGTNRQREGAPSEETLHSSGGSVSTNASTQPVGEAPSTAGTETSTRPPAPAPAARAAPQFTDVADGLRVARTSLAQNNLFDAKAAADAVLARDAGNEEAHAIQSEIAAREQRRDSALQSADRCVAQKDWACAQQQASEALAIDSSSQAAQSLMERAIVSTAWKPLNPPNGAQQGNAAVPPAPRAANTARLPSSQDWNTNASPPPLPNVPGVPNTSNVPNAATNPTTGATSDNSTDARQRAIVQNGWTHAAPAAASH
ncbi:hypothetical protein [Paraburkholderia sp. J76]|uniref:hypothetical protein n=1 Tax=Paraburkholderia sp. J76 TaxID=2805439 RepID=UPI002ABD3B3F|nr:hypothetical protein [Paraburkholderia sp. J76]